MTEERKRDARQRPSRSRILEKTAGEIEIQRGSAQRWSGEAQLWWRDATPGAPLVLELDVPRSARCKIKARLTKASDYGIFQFKIDGKEAGPLVDLYHPTVASTDELLLGTSDLARGSHRFEVRLAGANPEAVERHMIGLDYLRLERTP